MYEGNFAGGRRHGKGLLRFPDGRTYQGDFKDGKPNGMGTLKTARGAVLYEGPFVAGRASEGRACSSSSRPQTPMVG